MAGSTRLEISSQLGRTAAITGPRAVSVMRRPGLGQGRFGGHSDGRDDRKGRSAIEKISPRSSRRQGKLPTSRSGEPASVADFAQRMHARHSGRGSAMTPALPISEIRMPGVHPLCEVGDRCKARQIEMLVAYLWRRLLRG